MHSNVRRVSACKLLLTESDIVQLQLTAKRDRHEGGFAQMCVGREKDEKWYACEI